MNRKLLLAVGLAATFAATAVWHGPVGTADGFAARLERDARTTLDAFEMNQVSARVERAPIGRTLLLSGTADDFQRRELVRIMGQLPGVSKARWSSAGPRMPLLVEAWLVSLLAFLLGLFLAYLYELHRRANADRRW